ncbi:MAG: ABC transporter permease subunit [Spirochaetaceae bacterium]|jgi:putative spermidine/putrescine transport system permease protein|nr:ABC transporter permease subunit [Spirochaetaceae bacterium]
MVITGFRSPRGGGFTFQNYKDIFTQAIYLAAIRNSCFLSFLSAFIGLIISFATALSLSKISERSKGRFMSFLNMVSNFAGLPLSLAFMIMLGNAGVMVLILRTLGFDIGRYFNLFSRQGLLLLYVYFQIPLGTLLMIPGFQAIRTEWKESSDLMRANSLQFWWYVGLPMLIPSFAGTYGMLFANALTAYATPYMVMSTNYPLLPLKVTTMFTGEVARQPEMGSALSLVMISIMLLVIGLCNLFKTIFYKGGRR